MYQALPLFLQALPRLRPSVDELSVTKARFHSRAGPSGICSGQGDKDIPSSSNTFSYSLSVLLNHCSTASLGKTFKNSSLLLKFFFWPGS